MRLSDFAAEFQDKRALLQFAEAIASELEVDALAIERAIATRDASALREAAHRAKGGLLNAELDSVAAAALDRDPVPGDPFPEAAARALLAAVRAAPRLIRERWMIGESQPDAHAHHTPPPSRAGVTSKVAKTLGAACLLLIAAATWYWMLVGF